jgi:tRNA uridine 5-carboxymethylaminomethyl modification enzyme
MFDARESAVVERRFAQELEINRLAREISLTPLNANEFLEHLGSSPIRQTVKVAELARRQGLPLDALFSAAGVELEADRDAVTTVDLELKYAGYFERERVQADKLRRMAQLALPVDLPYETLLSLSTEARQKLAVRRPATLAQAASIPGVSPSDLQNLLIELERRRRVPDQTPVLHE